MNSIQSPPVAPENDTSPADGLQWLLDKGPALMDWIISSALVAAIIVGTGYVVFFAN